MNKAYLLIGGNMGKRENYLQQAQNRIEIDCGKIENESSIYETAAWGLENQPHFLNKALAISTVLSAPELLKCILSIEESLGRKRDVKFGPRLIDIDILLFNNEIIATDKLVVPHPQMQNRRFALMCLNDIAPDAEHPLLKKTIARLLAECTDPLAVHKY
ncbi:MAG TPA: 2-amino-4-hydroxy-6-hydroxymethyldihydropteridine diphosphokinase [Chitinophagaceae bacterium]|jgi:2-amino-4-hydroxy-6-hydroxymethyldihydropteridine diphosphokinase|nr:2-amino-4-hydroxy-6-hydroxymethyldihydropteridine diphosphokinase [Chitinophagaceae bacterium]